LIRPNAYNIKVVAWVFLLPSVGQAQEQPITLPDHQPTSLPNSQPTSSPVNFFSGLEIKGNVSIDTARIREKITQSLTEPLDEETIKENIKEIYKLGGIENVTVEIDDNNVLIFTITENPPIGEVLIKGELPFSGKIERRERKVRAWLRLSRSEPYDEVQVKKNEGLLLDELKKNGYHFATVVTTTEVKPPPEGAERGSVDITFTIDAGPKVIVSEVKFTGNQALHKQDLLMVTSSQTQRWIWRFLPKKTKVRFAKRGVFQERQAIDDALRMQTRYLDDGYVEIDVQEPKLTFNKSRDEVVIEFVIDEGARYNFGEVKFTGEVQAGVEKRAKSKSGQVFRRSFVNEDSAKLSTEMRDKGFGNASVIPQVKPDKEKKTVDVNYEFIKGGPVYINHIIIRGNQYTAEKIIRRELSLAEGELFSETKINESRERLLNTGLFGVVSISSIRGDKPNTVDLEVVVKDSKINFSSSVGPSTEQTMLASMRLGFYNLFGRGRTASFSYQATDTQQLLNASWVEPRLFDTKLIFATEVFFHQYSSQSLGARVDNLLTLDTPLLWSETGGGFEWAYPIHKSLWYYGGYSLSWRFGEVGFDDLPEGISALTRIGELSSGFEFDTRNARGFTSKGWYASLQGSVAPSVLGTEKPFLRGGVHATKFFTVIPSRDQNPGGFTAKLTGRLDGIYSLSDSDIPYPDRLLIGSIGSVRGFTAQSLGPRIELAEGILVLGGTRAVSFTAELEMPVAPGFVPPWLRRIRGAVFLDAGNAFGTLKDPLVPLLEPQLDFGVIPLRMAVGAGLRWYISWLSAPIRFEVAQPLDPKEGERFQFHFTLGTEL
jgi:outer membrane protein insertion porin family